jgi:hypothetical protein
MTGRETADVFIAQQRAFARLWPHVASSRLHIVHRRCPSGNACAPRDLAWYQDGDVFILARALRLPAEQTAALIAHELGHAADRRRWRAGSEQRADDLAAQALGLYIRYEPRHLVQTFGYGIYPRPKTLHA